MIEVNHICKDFISPKKYPGLKGAIKGLFSTEKVVKSAVSDISFTIQDGEIVGYIGSNGAGKSTTIKMMTGILKPTSGECRINGIDLSKNQKSTFVAIHGLDKSKQKVREYTEEGLSILDGLTAQDREAKEFLREIMCELAERKK